MYRSKLCCTFTRQLEFLENTNASIKLFFFNKILSLIENDKKAYITS